MSAIINTLDPNRPKKIAMVAANPSTSKQTGWPIGFWWAELTHPYWEFSERGYKVDIYSPDGGALQADAYSDPEDPSGYSAHDLISLGFKKSPTHAALIQTTKRIDEIGVADYDDSSLPGASRRCIRSSTTQRHQLTASFYEAGKVLGIVCHATCVLFEGPDEGRETARRRKDPGPASPIARSNSPTTS